MSLFSNSNELESRGDSFVWRRVLLSLVLLSILIVVSCASALYAPFQSDDERNITANPLVGLLTITPEIQFLNIARLHFCRMP